MTAEEAKRDSARVDYEGTIEIEYGDSIIVCTPLRYEFGAHNLSASRILKVEYLIRRIEKRNVDD